MPAVRINFYLLREIAVPSLLALLVFTFVLLMGRMLRLVEMVITRGVPFTEIFQLFIYLLPAFLVITLPLSCLLGVLLGFGRLSNDGEIIALKSSGVSLYDMLRPVVFFALLVSVATAGLTLWAEPGANTAFRSQVFEIAANRASIGIQPRIFNSDFDGLMLYTEEMDERQSSMSGIFISDDRIQGAPATITAARGRLLVNRETLTLTLHLEDGSIHRRPATAQEDYQTIRFATYDINLSLGQRANDGRPRRDKELSLGELLQARDEATTDLRRSSLTSEIHRRFTLPLAPILFALVAVPLGIQNQRSGRGGGFAVGLAVFLIYYILHSFAGTMAVEGGLPSVPVLWTPTLLFLAGGLYLVNTSARERRLHFLDHLFVEVPDALRRLIRRRKKR
jgi:lipopolysaccharide export system permease protein